jgi:hypothetical protein
MSPAHGRVALTRLRLCFATRARRSWWTVYAERKDDEDECAPALGCAAARLRRCALTRLVRPLARYVADTLLYDKTHLPRTAPAPDCVHRAPQPPPPLQTPPK